MKRYFFMSVFVAIAVMTVMVGCRKKKDTIAIIHVRDVSNQAVVGAQVILYGVSTTVPSQQANVVLRDTAISNSSGQAVFNFNDVYQLGQAGVAILNIEAVKDSTSGQGIIKIDEETTSEETVFVQ